MQRTYKLWREIATLKLSGPLAMDQKNAALSALQRGEPILVNDFVLKVQPCEWPDHPQDIGQQYFVDPPMCVFKQQQMSFDHPGPAMVPAIAYTALDEVATWVHPQPGTLNYDAMVNDFNRLVSEHATGEANPRNLVTEWSYVLTYAGQRSFPHPFSTSPIDDLRWKYLHEWGWGHNPLVSDRLSMGALETKHRQTGVKSWHAVVGKSGKWVFLEETEFLTERDALECTRTYVDKILQDKQQALDAKEAAKQAAKARKKGAQGAGDGAADGDLAALPSPKDWKRPIAPNVHLRIGFERLAATDKTELDLINTFGFRGIEFGNWVSQSERRDFVNATYDALLDMMELLGMPERFASLDGLLGLAYGSRGMGLSKVAAHFEPGNWILHLTKDNGPGALAHEYLHSLDAWCADSLWGEARENRMFKLAQEATRSGKKERFARINDSIMMPELATQQPYWGNPAMHIRESPIRNALERWNEQINPRYCQSNQASQAKLGRNAWRWLQTSYAMDVGRKPYWSTSAELLARGFEILIHDSLALKGRTSHMLVHGVSEVEGFIADESGRDFPYPIKAEERVSVCKEVAMVVRAFKAEYMHRVGRGAQALTYGASSQS